MKFDESVTFSKNTNLDKVINIENYPSVFYKGMELFDIDNLKDFKKAENYAIVKNIFQIKKIL